MPNTPPPPFDRLSALGDAQQRAYDHALTAQQHYDQAAEHRANANRATMPAAAGATEHIAAEVEAQRAERARAMADTWSRVTTALAASPTADGQPATYDLHVNLETPTDAQQAVRSVAATAARTGAGRS